MEKDSESVEHKDISGGFKTEGGGGGRGHGGESDLDLMNLTYNIRNVTW